jgi:hypothetical protein
MRALKILVVVMGMLLVGGTAALVFAIIIRANHRAAAPSATATTPAGRGFGEAIDLPPGASVLGVEGVGERLVIRLGLAQGGEALLLVDPRTGAKLGTIELRPTEAGAAKP